MKWFILKQVNWSIECIELNIFNFKFHFVSFVLFCIYFSIKNQILTLVLSIIISNCKWFSSFVEAIGCVYVLILLVWSFHWILSHALLILVIWSIFLHFFFIRRVNIFYLHSNEFIIIIKPKYEFPLQLTIFYTRFLFQKKRDFSLILLV